MTALTCARSRRVSSSLPSRYAMALSSSCRLVRSVVRTCGSAMTAAPLPVAFPGPTDSRRQREGERLGERRAVGETAMILLPRRFVRVLEQVAGRHMMVLALDHPAKAREVA